MDQYRVIPLGAKPDRQDRRDLYKSDRYKLSAPPPLPPSYVLPFLPPIKDQGQTSSCTGHSITYFSEILFATRINQFVQFSPWYTWYYARLAEGAQNRDDGVQMRTIMDAFHINGVCPLPLWPIGSDITQEPNDIAKISAAFKLPIYERCDTLQDIKYSLAIENQPVCLGVPVYDSWYNRSVQGTGLIPYVKNQNALGGHAVCVVGYDDSTQTIQIANSWGTGYGKDGFIFLPYAYLEDDWFDAWTAAWDTIPKI